MSLRLTDPLLFAARSMILIFGGLFALLAAILLIAAPLVLVMQDAVLAEFAKEGMRQGTPLVQPIVTLLLSSATLMGLLAWFLLNLLRIIESVQLGELFVPENARRLGRMAWITIAVQLTVSPLLTWARYLDLVVGNNGAEIKVQHSYNLDFGAILLVVCLFILARVFRHGAAMRDDLEGTV